jgi:hypothetical protein
MRRLCTALAVIAPALLASPICAQESMTPLGADAIKSEILGHRFDGYFASDNDAKSVKGTSYFGADGRFLLQVDIGQEPDGVILGKFELKDDQICVQQTGAMRSTIENRCFKAYGGREGSSWSGALSDVQDSKRGVPLDLQYDLDPAELDALWANWDSIQKEAGPIDLFGSMKEISINPYRFKGKVVLIKSNFRQMIGDGRAWFNEGHYYRDLIVEGVANDLFLKADQTALLIGELTGSFRATVEGSDVFFPVMTLKAARACKESRCKEYLRGWQ